MEKQGNEIMLRDISKLSLKFMLFIILFISLCLLISWVVGGCDPTFWDAFTK
jgi:hypothetical protein